MPDDDDDDDLTKFDQEDLLCIVEKIYRIADNIEQKKASTADAQELRKLAGELKKN